MIIYELGGITNHAEITAKLKRSKANSRWTRLIIGGCLLALGFALIIYGIYQIESKKSPMGLLDLILGGFLIKWCWPVFFKILHDSADLIREDYNPSRQHLMEGLIAHLDAGSIWRWHRIAGGHIALFTSKEIIWVDFLAGRAFGFLYSQILRFNFESRQLGSSTAGIINLSHVGTNLGTDWMAVGYSSGQTQQQTTNHFVYRLDVYLNDDQCPHLCFDFGSQEQGAKEMYGSFLPYAPRL